MAVVFWHDGRDVLYEAGNDTEVVVRNILALYPQTRMLLKTANHYDYFAALGVEEGARSDTESESELSLAANTNDSPANWHESVMDAGAIHARFGNPSFFAFIAMTANPSGPRFSGRATCSGRRNHGPDRVTRSRHASHLQSATSTISIARDGLVQICELERPKALSSRMLRML